MRHITNYVSRPVRGRTLRFPKLKHVYNIRNSSWCYLSSVPGVEAQPAPCRHAPTVNQKLIAGSVHAGTARMCTFALGKSCRWWGGEVRGAPRPRRGRLRLPCRVLHPRMNWCSDQSYPAKIGSGSTAALNWVQPCYLEPLIVQMRFSCSPQRGAIYVVKAGVAHERRPGCQRW